MEFSCRGFAFAFEFELCGKTIRNETKRIESRVESNAVNISAFNRAAQTVVFDNLNETEPPSTRGSKLGQSFVSPRVASSVSRPTSSTHTHTRAPTFGKAHTKDACGWGRVSLLHFRFPLRLTEIHFVRRFWAMRRRHSGTCGTRVWTAFAWEMSKGSINAGPGVARG